MGCACLYRNCKIEDIKNDEIKNEQNDISNIVDIENNDNNNNNNNGPIDNNNNNYNINNNIIINKSLNPGKKNLLSIGDLQTANKRTKFTQIETEEVNKYNRTNSDDKNKYKQVETDLITKKELDDFFSNYEALNDSVELEIRPPTSCENKAIYYGEWDIKNNKKH